MGEVREPVGDEAFGRRVSFLAEGVKRDSEESHLLKALSSGGGCTLKRKVRRPC